MLTALPELLRAIDQYRMVIYSLLLIVLMLTRPQGLFGRRELTFRRIKGWFSGDRDAGPDTAVA